MARSASFISAAVLLASMGAAQQNSMCYFPNGTPSPTDFVCNSSTNDGFSSCCGYQVDRSQAYCMSNGLCLSDMFLSRGSCTDKTWKSSNCAQVCTTTTPGAGLGIRPCGYNGTWDCGTGAGCQSSPILIPTGQFILQDAQLAAMGDQRIPASSPSSAASSSTATATATVTVTPAAAPRSSNSTGVVGVAVGVPLGVASFAFLALYLLERRKYQRMRQHSGASTHNLPSAQSPAFGDHHPSVSLQKAGIMDGGSGGENQRMPSSHHSNQLSPTTTYVQPSSFGQDVPMGAVSGMGGGFASTTGGNGGVKSMASQHSLGTSNPGTHPAFAHGRGGDDGVIYVDAGAQPQPPPPLKVLGTAGNSWATPLQGAPLKHHGLGNGNGQKMSAQELPTGR